MSRVLIVEDDLDLSMITRENMKQAGYMADQAYTCEQALKLLDKHEYDLVLLDEMLPDMRGSQLCKTVRDKCTCPIIFMSCFADSDTIINALQCGGDDYMVKPINYRELLARVEAVIRRSKLYSENANHETDLIFRQFTLDTQHHRLKRGDEEIELSSTEYTILEYMIHHPDTLLLYHDLYENVWGNDSLGDVRTIMVHISNLRKKLDPDKTGIIQTVRGAGYIFSDV